MGTRNRPLSPHLGIYKWQLNMALSILHRATGVFLAFGLIVFAWWLMAIAAGPDQLAGFMALAAHPVGQLTLLGISYALIYHALNGVRHLYWDSGRGYALETVKNSGLLVLVLSVAFTALLWMFDYGII